MARTGACISDHNTTMDDAAVAVVVGRGLRDTAGKASGESLASEEKEA